MCREFAREGKIDVVCLRLGALTWNGEDDPEAVSVSTLYVDDAVQAVEKALDADVGGWDIIHVQSPVPRARYHTMAAERTLGFEPR